MPFFTNPFKKHDVSEFPGVLVPLERAHHRSSIATERRSSLISQLSHKSEKHEENDSDSGHGVIEGLTIETLRAEIEADLAAVSIVQNSHPECETR
jgi:hypothetical protein